MKHKTWHVLAITLVVVLGLCAGVLIMRQKQAQASQPRDVQPLAVVGSSFTYQGRLTDSSTGDPVAGPCDFQFSLWNASVSGSQIGSTQTKTSTAKCK